MNIKCIMHGWLSFIFSPTVCSGHGNELHPQHHERTAEPTEAAFRAKGFPNFPHLLPASGTVRVSSALLKGTNGGSQGPERTDLLWSTAWQLRVVVLGLAVIRWQIEDVYCWRRYCWQTQWRRNKPSIQERGWGGGYSAEVSYTNVCMCVYTY